MTRLSLRTAAASLLIALSIFASGPASAADAPTALRPVTLSIDERAVRAAGIQLSPIQPESGATDLSFPGMVAVPPQQIRVVAAPAAGLIETVLVPRMKPCGRGRSSPPCARPS